MNWPKIKNALLAPVYPICAMGGKPKAPPPPPPPPPPPAPIVEDNKEAEKAAALERKRIRGLSGRASTILTSGEGVLGEPTTNRNTILGAG